MLARVANSSLLGGRGDRAVRLALRPLLGCEIVPAGPRSVAADSPRMDVPYREFVGGCGDSVDVLVTLGTTPCDGSALHAVVDVSRVDLRRIDE